MNATAPSLLDAVLAPGGLDIRFQPIIELVGRERRIFAFECLARGPSGTNIHEASVLFEYVRWKGATRVIDELCVDHALRHAMAVSPHDVSINVHASSLAVQPTLVGRIAGAVRQNGFDPSNVIVEIVEHGPAIDAREFRTSVEILRNVGFRIALDDLGLGNSNLKLVIETVPDFYKIDRYFIGAIARDPRRAAVVESILTLAVRLGGRVIAEGVDSPEVESVVRSLGIDLLQGYHYSPPLARTAVRTYLAGEDPPVLMEAGR